MNEMTPQAAMHMPLSEMNEAELRYTLAYCDGEVRRAASNGPRLDYYENRRIAAELELAKRKR